MAASRKNRTLALALDRKLQREINALVRRTSKIGNQARNAAIRAQISGDNPTEASSSIINNELRPILVGASVIQHLQGRLFIAERSKGRTGIDARIVDAQSDKVIEALGGRMSLTTADLDDLKSQYGPIAVNATNGMNAHLENVVQRDIGKALATGPLTTREGADVVRLAFEKAGMTQTSPFLFETIWRTQVQLAFSAGRWNMLRDPAIQEILWGFEYVTVGDDRVRPEHELLDGIRRPKGDPFWTFAFPPNGFNCRCQVIEIFNDQAALAQATPIPGQTEVDGKLITPGPDPGFAFNPGTVATDIISRAIPVG